MIAEPEDTLLSIKKTALEISFLVVTTVQAEDMSLEMITISSFLSIDNKENHISKNCCYRDHL